ncbi:endoribonuclease CG2145-like [Eupeodes corollae]|uniref:endoribonuclease CG2145-like n=1 Tax=Eupeodes corollae TaxID=290404 RepID=UPI00249058D6|nr:endoribonuclease CG2145-like [Eupeodes corollae]
MGFSVILSCSLIVLVFHYQIADCRDYGATYGNNVIPQMTDYFKPNQYPSGYNPNYDFQPDISVGPRGLGPDSVTDYELLQLSEDLYEKENSKLDQVRVNMQGRTRSIDTNDEAPEPLLQVSETVLRSPTIAKMLALFDNYEMDTSINEVVTSEELQEEDEFIEAVMATNVMRQTMSFLQKKGIVSSNPKDQRNLLKTIWFTLYSRGQRILGSSGFEHVFLNEINRGKIIGLHNWVYFNEEEKAGNLDYKGYLNKVDLGNKGKIIGARFTYNGLVKPVNTMFVGTSPELELALYTICFELRADQICPVSLGGKKFTIQTNTWRWDGLKLIGSAFPRI